MEVDLGKAFRDWLDEHKKRVDYIEPIATGSTCEFVRRCRELIGAIEGMLSKRAKTRFMSLWLPRCSTCNKFNPNYGVDDVPFCDEWLDQTEPDGYCHRHPNAIRGGRDET